MLFSLQMLGLQPILAHPERYNYYYDNFEQYERFKELGCKLQLNLLSLSGGYGPQVKKTAEKLLKKKMIDFVGTDMHHEKHLAMLQNLASQKAFYDLLADTELLNNRLM
jgi:protein-tyrosine phosphatase